MNSLPFIEILCKYHSLIDFYNQGNDIYILDEHAKKKIVNVIKSLKRGLSSSQMDHDYVFPSTDEMDQEVSLGKEKSEKVENTNTMDVEPDKISSVRKRYFLNSQFVLINSSK